MKQRRLVEVPDCETRRGNLWAYGYATLARLFGTSKSNVRKMVEGKKFDPASFEDVVRVKEERALARRTKGEDER